MIEKGGQFNGPLGISPLILFTMLHCDMSASRGRKTSWPALCYKKGAQKISFFTLSKWYCVKHICLRPFAKQWAPGSFFKTSHQRARDVNKASWIFKILAWVDQLNLRNLSFASKGGQKVALRAPYVVIYPKDLWTLSAPSFCRYWKQQIGFAY